jgi:crossover junction endodeoxyribonuclease RuvC
MRILGIDPGIAICGYGVVEELPNGDVASIAFGVIETPKQMPLAQRLNELHIKLRALVEQWKPDEVAVEELFFATNAKTAITVGQARGVVLLSLYQAGLVIAEYTPLQVKQAVSGYGAADKKQVQEMVRLLLNLKTAPKPDDAADALAIALTHQQSRRWNALAAT